MSYKIIIELNDYEDDVAAQMATLAKVEPADIPDWLGTRFLEEFFRYAEEYIAKEAFAAGVEQVNQQVRAQVEQIQAVKAIRFPPDADPIDDSVTAGETASV